MKHITKTVDQIAELSAERATLDPVAVRNKLSRQFIAAHTRVTEVVTASLKGYNKDRRVA